MKFNRLSFLALSLMSTTAFAAPTTLTVGDTQGTINTVLKDNRTLVPLREVGDLLDFRIDYEPTPKIITITRGHDIKLRIDSSMLYMNGDVYALDTYPVVIDGKTYLPLRVIAEAFGHEISSDTTGLHLTDIRTANSRTPKVTATIDADVRELEQAYNVISNEWEVMTDAENVGYIHLLFEQLLLTIDFENALVEFTEVQNGTLTPELEQEFSRVLNALYLNGVHRDTIPLEGIEYTGFRALEITIDRCSGELDNVLAHIHSADQATSPSKKVTYIVASMDTLLEAVHNYIQSLNN